MNKDNLVNESEPGKNAVVASDARPGTVVVLDSVLLEEGGFVTIQEDAGGLPGLLLGVTDYLSAGSRTGVPIKLLRDSRDGELLHAVIRKDDGDKKFDAAKDLPILVNGEAIVMRFRIDKNAPTPYDSKL